MRHPKRKFLFEPLIFRGELLVSGRLSQQKTSEKAAWDPQQLCQSRQSQSPSSPGVEPEKKTAREPSENPNYSFSHNHGSVEND